MKTLLTSLFCFAIFISHAQIEPLLEHDWRLEKVVIDNEEILATQSVGSTEFEDWAHIYFYEENSFSFVWLLSSLTYNDENSSFVIHSFGGDFGSYHDAPSTAAFIYDFLGENGTDTSDLNLVFTYSFRYEDGLIYLDIVNEAGDVATFFTTTLNNTNFEKIELALYPNPTSDVLYIETPQTTINTVEIFDVQGKSIKQTSITHTNNINVIDLANGMYFIKIATANGQVTRKFVKK